MIRPLFSWSVILAHGAGLLLAAAGALGILWLSGWLYLLFIGDEGAGAMGMGANRLALINGRSEAAAAEMVITDLPRDQPGLLVARVPPFRADRYAWLGWEIEAPPGTILALTWVSSSQPQLRQRRPLRAEEVAASRVDLGSAPGWEGQIQQLGLLLSGPVAEPILVRRLLLVPRAPTFLSIPPTLAAVWTQVDGWSGRAINFHAGTGQPPLALAPVFLVALWVLLAWTLARGLSRVWPGPSSAWTLAILILAGWLALDARWQWLLGTRLLDTQAQAAQFSTFPRPQGAQDEQLLKAAGELKQRLPLSPSRLFVLSKEPRDYLTGRLGYHLLPHRVFSSQGLPRRQQVKAGDYILLFRAPEDIRFDGSKQQLSGKGVSLPARHLSEMTGVGSLYQIRGGKG